MLKYIIKDIDSIEYYTNGWVKVFINVVRDGNNERIKRRFTQEVFNTILNQRLIIE
jgi:hypothetical protein